MVVAYNAPFQIGHLSDKSKNKFSRITGENQEQAVGKENIGHNNGEDTGSGGIVNTEREKERRRKLMSLTSASDTPSQAPTSAFTGRDKEGKRKGGNQVSLPKGTLFKKESSAELARKATLRNLIKRHDKKSLFNSASDADLYELAVMEGDVIVMGTDGLFDNLFVSEIASILDASLPPGGAAPSGVPTYTRTDSTDVEGELDKEIENVSSFVKFRQTTEGTDMNNEQRAQGQVQMQVQQAVDQLSKRVLGTVFNRKKATPHTLAHLAYSRQKPTVESALRNLFSGLVSNKGGKDIGKGTSSDTSATDERDACRGDPRDTQVERSLVETSLPPMWS